MRPIATCALLFACALAAAPAAADAAAPWSEPSTVAGSTTTNPFSTGLALGDGERGTVGFTSALPSPPGECTQASAIARTFRGAAAGPRTLAPYDLAAPPVMYASTGAILLQRRMLDCHTARLAVSFASPSSAIGTRHVLHSSLRLHDAAIAVTDSGRAAIAWTEDRGYLARRARPDRLYLSLRGAGGAFGKPTVLVGSGKLSSVSVAHGERGDLLVAFERQAIDSRGRPGPRRVQARFRRAGHSFGAIEDLGPEQGVTDLVTAVGDDGRGHVAWGTQDGGIEANKPFSVHAATKTAGPHRFGAAVHLFRGSGSDIDRPQGRLGIAVARQTGQAMLAFNGVGNGGPGVGTVRPVLVSLTDARGTFRAPVSVAGANGVAGGIAVQPDGAATIVWTGQRPGGPEHATGIFAATRTAGGAFAQAELVARVPELPVPVAAVAAPARGGAVQAAWVDYPTGVRISRRG